MVLKMSLFDGRTLTLVVQMTPPSEIATDAVHLPVTLCCGLFLVAATVIPLLFTDDSCRFGCFLPEGGPPHPLAMSYGITNEDKHVHRY